jgi:glycosyltransferase involved in cell wall biosynthesis
LKNPKISIITPSFNQGQFIEETIDSVLSQNYSDLDYVIIDGGSTDNSVEIIKKYEKHLSYWVSEPDKGQSHAINKGLKVVSGEVVNWLNSDDFLALDALHRVSEVFSNPETKAYCARSTKFDENSQYLSRGTEVYSNNLEKTLGWARIDQPETWFRKAAFDVVGEVSEAMHYLMDREWWIRYLFTYGLEGIVQTDDVIVNFRLHADSKTVSQSEAIQIDHDTLFLHLATKYKRVDIVDFLQKNFDVRKDYNLPHIDISNCSPTLFDYYLVRKADEAYFSGNIDLSRKMLAMIVETSLDLEAKKLYNRLTLRSHPLIYPLISWTKKTRLF